ncbi:DUF1631 family protein [Massilia sp. W12]|uniref:DUF1631 family protein n=1 Tax=Massilia sp. W12 TaxID=3126507 RepID=UPI0030CF7FDC
MVENFVASKQAVKPRPPSRQTEVLQSLIPVSARAVNELYAPFVARLCEAMMQCAEKGADAKTTNFCFRANNLLKAKGTAYLGLVLQTLGGLLLQEVGVLEHGVKARAPVKLSGGLSLVSYDEMESKVMLSSLARPFEIRHVDQLAALNIRLAFLLERDQISNAQNPFRPDIFLAAFQQAWSSFDEELNADQMLLPFLTEDNFIDLGPVYQALNNVLKSRAILPGAVDARRGKSVDMADPHPTVAPLPPSAFAPDPEAIPPLQLSQQLRRLFERSEAYGSPWSAGQNGPAHGAPSFGNFAPGGSAGAAYQAAGAGAAEGAGAQQAAPEAGAGGSGGDFVPDLSAIHDFGMNSAQSSKQLFSFLADLQQKVFSNGGASMLQQQAHAAQHSVGGAAQGVAQGAGALGAPAELDAQAQQLMHLPMVKQQAPKGALTRIDETTIDLLAKIFETVFRDPAIPLEIKELVGVLQIPVLKAALMDKEFFYQEEHPARRLIELLTQISIGWEQRQGRKDPMYQALQRSLDRIQRETDVQTSHFSEAVNELESLIREDEQATETAIAAPISAALRQEKLVQANKTARNEVEMRIGTGEVVAFVETFLENKWVNVLTIAYSVQDEKPEAVKSAVKTMDDLIWSVKPKITAQERKELIGKLPTMLAMLNKWLNVVKWDDAERLQFFAELAETHASIVRAPLELTPERQLEIAVSVAKQAAERRMQRAALKQEDEETVYDESNETVERLQRGMWLEFAAKENGGVVRRLKLAWISPLRSLFIFSAGQRQESFSLSAEQLAQHFRDKTVHVLRTGGVVTSALTKALGGNPVNDEAVQQFA